MKVRFLPAAMDDLAAIEAHAGPGQPAWHKNARQVYREAKAQLAAQREFAPVGGTLNVGRVAIPGTFVIVYYQLSASGIIVLRLWDALTRGPDLAEEKPAT